MLMDIVIIDQCYCYLFQNFHDNALLLETVET